MSRYTAPVRRGFEHILKFWVEDIDHAADSPKHPGLRRLKGQELKDAIACIHFMQEEAERERQRKSAPPDRPPPPAEF